MIFNGKTISLKNLSAGQLTRLDDALEAVFFKESHLFLKGEPFAPTFRKDKKHFKDLISAMIGFKRDLMKYFQKQYDNRQNLVRTSGFKLDEVINESDYLYEDGWDEDDDELALIIEKKKRESYDLGILALLVLYGKQMEHTSYDAGVNLVKDSKDIASTINAVTKKRIIQAIKDSLDLGEDRAAFEARLKKIFINQYRGRLIAQNEAIESYLTGKDTAAKRSGEFTKKTWRGVQPDDSEICGSVLDETVGINDIFSNGLDGPPPHLNCKCDLDYS